MTDGNVLLDEIISLHGWRDIPSKIITREGFVVYLTDEKWIFPIYYMESPMIIPKKIINMKLRWSMQVYVIHRMERVSTSAGYQAFIRVWTKVLKYQEAFSIGENDDFKDRLILLIEDVIFKARAAHTLYTLYEAIRWYIWCAEHYPELGFCPAYSMELEGMVIPGGPKGEAVRQNDGESGPLHRILELPLLINALRDDSGSSLEHLQQRGALALSLALGRNPANLTYLQSDDLVDMTPNSSERCYVIHMPRIKKRQMDPRDDLLAEYIIPSLAGHLLELIKKNNEIDMTMEKDGKIMQFPRPMFINIGMNQAALTAGQWKYAFNMTSWKICGLVQKFVARHKIISPVTQAPLHITIRRLRYTLATNLVAEGISKRELARVLDHTDTQHVGVYFEMAGSIVKYLDKAAAKDFARYVNLFRGMVINDVGEALNGDRTDKHVVFVPEKKIADQTDIGICGKKRICHLDPPYSCYLCPKFQPYRHANHEYVLDCLLESREERMGKYQQARVGVQLDDVIMAVAKVVIICKET